MEIGADILGDDLRDLCLELLHERLVEVASRLPPGFAACAYLRSQLRSPQINVCAERLTCSLEIPSDVFGRVVLEELLLECSERHVRQDDLLAERLEGLLALEERPLRRHLDDRTEESGCLGDKLLGAWRRQITEG